MTISFKTDSFSDLLLFSGYELSYEELKSGMKQSLYSIDPEKDFQKLKLSYWAYKNGLDWEGIRPIS